jgi:hypothetical protein
MPGVVFSLLLIAAGAILAFAVTTTVEGVDLVAVGVILMIVGGLGLVLSLLYTMSLLPWTTTTHEDTYVERHDHVR